MTAPARRAAALIAFVAFVMMCAAQSRAQSSPTSQITGTVFDPDGAAVVRAMVTVSGPSLIGGPRETETDQDGRYRVTDLPPGVYEATALASGFTGLTRSGLQTVVGQTMTLDFVLRVASVRQEVRVEAQAPIVDVRSSSAPVTLDREFLLNLPTGRSLSSVLNLSPGVAGDVAFGGNQGGNGFYVEGEDATDPFKGGSWTRFNSSWLQEVQVVGLGAGVEHGGFTGVAANAIVRSGGNRFSGLGEYWTTPAAWVATNTGPTTGRFVGPPIVESRNGNAQVGGPIAGDRVWFFTAVEDSVLATRPIGYTGPGSVRAASPGAIGKVTAALSPAIRVEGFYRHGHDQVDGAGLGSLRPMETAWLFKQTDDDWSARLDWTLGARTLLEARGTGYVSPDNEGPRPPNTIAGPAPHFDMTTGMQSVNVPYYYDANRKRVGAAAVLSHFADRFAGSHELKFGAEFERVNTSDRVGYPGNIAYYDIGTQPYEAFLWQGQTQQSAATRTTVYGGDRWAPASRLTVDGGVRADFNRGRVPVKGQVFATNAVSPRVGIAWDATGDHRTVVRAHWGRYADPMFTYRVGQVDTSDSPPVIVAQVLGPNQFVELDSSDTADHMTIDPNIRQSHVDQALVGVEREVFWRIALTAQFIDRRFANFMGMLDTGSVWAPITWQDPGRDGKLGTADDGPVMTIYNKLNPGHEQFVFTNPPTAWRRYRGFQLIATRRLSGNWEMQASWTWSHAAGNVGNMQGSSAGLYDLGSPVGEFVNPNRQINMGGGIPFDFSEGKVLATYRLPFWGGINVGGVYRYHTGQAYGRIAWATHLNQGANRIRTELIGTYHTPAINQVDARIEKTFRATRAAQLGLYFDVFNAANQGVANAEVYPAVNEFSGQNWGTPGAWVDPRRVQVGLRVTF